MYLREILEKPPIGPHSFSIDLPIEDALKEEAYWLYQSMSKTPAQKRFQYADDNGAQNDMDNQRNWDQLVMGIQEVK